MNLEHLRRNFRKISGATLDKCSHSRNQDYSFNYLEKRNDIGLIFDFSYDQETQGIKIKRDKNNYPIVRYSLFNDINIKPNKTVIKKINNQDLSQLNDKELINFILEVDNNQNLYQEMLSEPWFKNNKVPEFVKPENVLNFVKDKL